MYTKTQLRNLFKADKKEAETLRNVIEKRYDKSYQHMTIDKFLDWYFEDYCFDVGRYLKYVKVPKDLKRKKQLGNLIKFKDELYAKVSVWKNDEGNLKLTTLSIGDLMKHFVEEPELEKTLATYIKDGVLFNLSKLIYPYVKTKDYKTKDFPTIDDWYGSFVVNNKQYVEGRIYQVVSNLDLWSIHLAGNDDYSITQSFISKQEAIDEWDRLGKLKSVPNEMKDYYFSN